MNSRIERAAAGENFPQFTDTWNRNFMEAEEIVCGIEDAIDRRARVALATSEPERFSAFFVAAARSNLDLFLFNPNWGSKELGEAVRIAAPDCIIDFNENRFEPAKAASGTRMGSPEGLRVMIATGGTSGRIRFAEHDWGTFSSATEGLQLHLGVDSITSMCMLPLYHVSGFMQIVRALITGGKIWFSRVDRFKIDCAGLFAASSGPAFLSLVPTQLADLIRDEGDLNELRRFHAVFVGGGPIPPELASRSRTMRLPLAPTYGMTETAAQVATSTPEEFLNGLDGPGRPLPHVRVEIFDDTRTTGAPGVIALRSASLFHGYYGEGPSEIDPFQTLDTGSIDSDGRLRVTGRIGRSIISGGENIDLQEIEKSIDSSGLVREVAAFGVEDQRWGERLCAAYVPFDPDASPLRTQSIIAESLSGFKVPKSWLSLKAIPRTSAGKLDVSRLREMERESS